MARTTRILVAEDDSADTFFLQHAFAKAGTSVMVDYVSDGVETIEYLETNYAVAGRGPAPDVLLLDLKMPRMDGFEVLEWLRQHATHRPPHIVVLSASDRPADISRASALGATLYLIKPSNPTELVVVVRQLEEYWTCQVAGNGIPD
jgi:CheY-like chemotaxis protein